MSPLVIVAPTDAQLDCIAALCRERGWPPPAVVASKQEASEIIGAIQTGSYRVERYEWPSRDLTDRAFSSGLTADQEPEYPREPWEPVEPQDAAR